MRVGGLAGTVQNHSPIQRSYLPVLLFYGEQSHTLQALIDSGSDKNLICSATARRHGIPLLDLDLPLTVQTLDGSLLNPITKRTSPVLLRISGNHSEVITFYVMENPHVPIVLGFPWLSLHNPHINWSDNTILGWSPFCLSSCLKSALMPISLSPATEEFPDLSKVPQEYMDLKPVFSKSHAVSLPPHRPYDCAIELLPGTSPPKGRLYSLSPSEREAMNRYISDSLAAGIIRPSSSPAGAGFFFVGKKDGSLRPCIDYRGLNDITIKNRYPLPLMSTAFELLQGAQFFTKLDLRNAYHLVRIREGDEWKTAFNTPTGHYEYLVVPFGLTNAPAVFQALVNDVLRDFLDIFVYLDDILIFFHILLTLTGSMSDRFSSGCSRTNFSSRQRNANFIETLSLFWASSSPPPRSRWTPRN